MGMGTSHLASGFEFQPTLVIGSQASKSSRVLHLSITGDIGQVASNNYDCSHFHNIQKFIQTDRSQGAKHLNEPD